MTRQVRNVLADVPRFLTAPLLRHWHRHWGATRAEVAAAMPGDDLLPRAQYRCTRAITIAATPDEVWPWLVQVGCLRAGWYADDLLDNLAHPAPPGSSRLVTRLHACYDGPSALTALTVLLMEVGDFPMMRRMLRGIQERAEAEHRRRTPTGR